MSGLSISGLHAGHGRTGILDGIDLAVPNGALACVLGPSGCGKSTLLRVIAGFHPAKSGRIMLGDRVLDDGRLRLPAERRRVGYVPQDGALFPHLSVAGNIGFGLSRGGRRDRVAELVELVGLTGLEKRYPHQLSGGQQQRVALARALAPQPELLLLDEPFAALDAALRTEVRAEVAAMLRRAGTTAILVTHDHEEALTFADVIAVMRDGRIAQTGTPDALYHRPADAGVARFLGEANLLAAEIENGSARTAFGELPLTNAAHEARNAMVMVRPRQVRLAASAYPGTVKARVAHCHFRGHDYRVEIVTAQGDDLPGRLIAYIDTAPPQIGDTVHVAIHGQAHHCP
ncbi:MAG: ABC transporter ATP-binding protein [Catenulispora sp.]|nr:ABC transporter ATP-binding protein [Catenulispora sp.]NUR57267.1 ABC transporter ATP-binding protein [Catenulispora sp.]